MNLNKKKEMKISRTDYFRRIAYGNPYSIAEKNQSIPEILNRGLISAD